jgi:hypothetical protein
MMFRMVTVALDDYSRTRTMERMTDILTVSEAGYGERNTATCVGLQYSGIMSLGAAIFKANIPEKLICGI